MARKSIKFWKLFGAGFEELWCFAVKLFPLHVAWWRVVIRRMKKLFCCAAPRGTSSFGSETWALPYFFTHDKFAALIVDKTTLIDAHRTRLFTPCEAPGRSLVFRPQNMSFSRYNSFGCKVNQCTKGWADLLIAKLIEMRHEPRAGPDTARCSAKSCA